MKREELQVRCTYKDEVTADKVFERSFRIFADRALTERGESRGR